MEPSQSGTPTEPQLWPCPRCKTPIPGDSTFCPRCGLQLVQPSSAVGATAAPSTTSAAPTGWRAWSNAKKAVVFGGIALLILLVIGAVMGPRTPADTAVPARSPQVTATSAAVINSPMTTATVAAEPTSSPSLTPTPTPAPSPTASPAATPVVVSGLLTFVAEQPDSYSFTMADRCSGNGPYAVIREGAPLMFSSGGDALGAAELRNSTLADNGCIFEWSVTLPETANVHIVLADVVEWNVPALRDGHNLHVEAQVIAPEPTPGPAFADIELSGRGSRVVRFEIPAFEDAIAEVSYAGQRNFIIWSIDEDGDKSDLLVNTIDNYSGTVLLTGSDHPVGFEITATGNWTITIKPTSSARTWDGTGPIEGRGDDVIRVIPPADDLFTITLTHRGQSNFIIWAYDGSFPDLVVNEIGRFEGQVLMPDGELWAITAGGNWSIAPGE